MWANEKIIITFFYNFLKYLCKIHIKTLIGTGMGQTTTDRHRDQFMMGSPSPYGIWIPSTTETTCCRNCQNSSAHQIRHLYSTEQVKCLPAREKIHATCWTKTHGTLVYRPCSAPLAATIQQAGDTRMSNGSAVAICYVLRAISLLDNADTNLLPASSHKQHKLLNRHLVQRRLFRVKRLMHHNASPPSENDSFSWCIKLARRKFTFTCWSDKCHKLSTIIS